MASASLAFHDFLNFLLFVDVMMIARTRIEVFVLFPSLSGWCANK